MTDEQKPDEQKPSTEKPTFPKRKSADYVERYANNFFFESSFWDLKLIFGILDQSEKPNPTSIHTTVNVPWAQAKIAAYVMLVNVVLQERYGEPIKVRGELIPMPVEEAVTTLGDTLEGAEIVRILKTVHEGLFGKRDAHKTEASPASE